MRVICIRFECHWHFLQRRPVSASGGRKIVASAAIRPNNANSVIDMSGGFGLMRLGLLDCGKTRSPATNHFWQMSEADS